jgi:hypothetical protein
LGKMLATRVRRRSSRLILSRPLVVRRRTLWAAGKSKTVRPSGTATTLTIQGFQISLAGLVLPLLIALFAGRQISLRSVPRSGWLALAASLLVNLIMVVQQASSGFPGGGVHLVPVGMLLLLWDAIRFIWPLRLGEPEYLGKPRGVGMLLVLGFFGMLLPDALGSVWMALQSGFAPVHGFQWVGGAGWSDGLLATVASTAILGGVLDYAVRRLPKQAFRQVAPALA